MIVHILVDRKTDAIRGTSPMGYGPDAIVPDGCEILAVEDVEDGLAGARFDRAGMRLVPDEDLRAAIAVETVEGKLVGLYIQGAGLQAAEEGGVDTKGAMAAVEARIAELQETLSDLRGA